MKLEHVKRNLNQIVHFVDPWNRGEEIAYKLAGCMMRKNEAGYFYEVELHDLKAKSSIFVTKLEKIKEVQNEEL